jgi:outer membrane murein-binding lipoprotein Lpp
MKALKLFIVACVFGMFSVACGGSGTATETAVDSTATAAPVETLTVDSTAMAAPMDSAKVDSTKVK